MNVLLADIGNSSIKLCRYETRAGRDAALALASIERLPTDVPHDAWVSFEESLTGEIPQACYLSSVNGPAAGLLIERLEASFPTAVNHVVTVDRVPISIAVETPETLGVDRLLAAFAATSIRPESNSPRIVIDAGTAVTIDLVDRESVFQGGVIFPGLETSLGSLNANTADLPNMVERLNSVPLDLPIGKSTETAIARGVVQAQIGAILTVVQNIVDSIPDRPAPIVIASGGGMERLRPWLPDNWVYAPQLVLRGLALVAESAPS